MVEMDLFKKSLFGFKMIYMLYLLLAFNSFVNGMAWLNSASYLIVILGIVLIIWMAVRWKRYKNAVNLWTLILFIASYLISAVTHISYGFTENVKGAIWLIFPIVLVYIPAFNMSKEEMRLEQNRLFSIYVLYTVAANVVSLSMVYWGRMFDFQDKTGAYHVIGYRWNRLWGIYDDPNHGATITVIAMFMILYFLCQSRKIWQKVLLIIAYIINYLYVILSDSRTGVLSLIVGTVIGGLYYIWAGYKKSDKKTLLPKKIILVLLAGTILFTGTYAVKQLYQPLDKKIAAKVNEDNGIKKKNQSNARTVNLKKDYSNGRFGIWESGIQIAKSSPVIGVGYRNMTAYTEEHLPEAYLVNPENGGTYDSMHNLELDILVSQGCVGIVLFILLLGNTCVVIIKNTRKISEEVETEVMTSMAVFVALGTASTFLSFIFYVNAPQNFMFWLFLGYLMRYCQMAEDKDKEII